MNKRFLGCGRKIFGIGCENARSTVENQYARLLGPDRTKIAAQRVARDFPESARHFHPGSAGAHDHKR